jgi:anthranilate synthase component 1
MNPAVRELDYSVDLLALHRLAPARFPFLLQSTARGRFDILFAQPGESLVLDSSLRLHGPCTGTDHDFLATLDRWWHRERTAETASTLPFIGGWFVFLGYELAGQIEPCLRLPEPDTSLPVAWATRVTNAVIVDHELQRTYVICEAGAGSRQAQVLQDIAALCATIGAGEVAVTVQAIEEDPEPEFLAAVQRILDYIVAGDVFQVNLSRGWRLRLPEGVTAVQLCSNLRIHNPAPFSGLALWEHSAIISSSPERLVKVRKGVVETRPIAGTRPRAVAQGADRAYSDELLAHPKERAEHIMLIDLERNDLGRICVPGTIEVNELMALESFAHVHHIVSNVRGRLRPGITPGEVLRAVFPGGTITGCPKVRCMQIIAELEQQPRGAYTGSMGYLNRDGSMDMNILIRTMVCHGSRLQLRAGAGIVADSVAAAELAETRAKARGLLRALGVQQA